MNSASSCSDIAFLNVFGTRIRNRIFLALGNGTCPGRDIPGQKAGYCLETPVKNPYGTWLIHVHCNDRNEGKLRPEYHSLHHTGLIRKQVVTRFAFCSDCRQILHNFLSIPGSVLYFRQWHRYGNHSKYDLLTGDKTAPQKGEIIQEMLYRKLRD